MNFRTFRSTFKDFPVFSFDEVRKLFPTFSRIQLNRWQKDGLIKKIVKKYYYFTDEEVNEHLLFLMANTIYHPSYVSYEMALNYYDFIPEGVFIITSATSRHTYKFSTEIITFLYRKIRSDLFWGYDLINYKNYSFKIADPEKTLLDYFYLHPELKDFDDFEGMRVNVDIVNEEIDVDKFKSYLDAFKNKNLTKRMNTFLKFLKNA